MDLKEFLQRLTAGTATWVETDWFNKEDRFADVPLGEYRAYAGKLARRLDGRRYPDELRDIAADVAARLSEGPLPAAVGSHWLTRFGSYPLHILPKTKYQEPFYALCAKVCAYEYQEGVDVAPLKAWFTDDFIDTDPETYAWLMKVLYRFPDQDAEHFLLEQFRSLKPLNILKTHHNCAALAEIGTLRSLPVLVAYRKDMANPNAPRLHGYLPAIDSAFDAICRRLGMDDEFRDTLRNENTWKETWAKSLKDFVGYVESYALFIAAGQGGMPEGLVDRLGDFMMEEMIVDTRPYTTFRELRLLHTDPADAQRRMATQMRDEVGAILAMEEGIADTGVTYNDEYLPEGFITDLRTDYFVTRLRRLVKVREDR